MKNKILLFALLVIWLLAGCGSETEMEIETYKVKRGDFLYSVVETGELEAVNSIMIKAPSISWRFGGLQITDIIEDGAQVKNGDLIVRFDQTEVKKALDDAEAALEIAKAELRKAQASNASRMKELESDLEKTQLQYKISQLNLEKATYESEIRKKEIQLELDRSVITLEKAKQEIENQKNVSREELNKLQLQVHQEETKFEEAQITLDKLTITAPSPGIAILERNRSTDDKYQVDDNVWRGNSIAKLPDLTLMSAKVPVNEVDIAKIDTLQQVNIRLDAYPDSVFTGIVTDIATLARNKERDSKVKVFDVIVNLDRTHEALMPGMTVSCEIVIDRIADTLYVPIEAVFHKDGQDVVYVKKGRDFDTVPVTLGSENDDYVIVAKGIEPNMELALVDPEIFKAPEEKEKGEES